MWGLRGKFDLCKYEKIIRSVYQLIEDKKVLTPDLGGTASTQQLGDELVSILSRI